MSNSIKDALKKLCLKLTGKKSNKESINGVIDDITDNYNGGGETYTAGTGIEITNENVINNKALLHAYEVSIFGEFDFDGGTTLDLYMLIYSNRDDLTTELITQDFTILNNYKYTSMVDENDHIDGIFFIKIGSSDGVLYVDTRSTRGLRTAENPTITLTKRF